MDQYTHPSCILATNTSSISITQLAEATQKPANVIGMHFMNPVPVMKLVEIINGKETSSFVTDAIVSLTTTIGKIATAQTALGTTVLMAAGDTFRAAAAEQLQVWAERSGASFVRGAEGGDPASVIFDGIQSASAKGIQLVLGDTAGRLQNKSNLMEELKKVLRVADKAEGVVNEVLLVIDATTGQNGLAQAREFAAATDVTGIVLTKLDGSAKGGIVFAIETELGIPVKLVGLGETAVDLIVFDPSEFVSALFE
jgi:fused signal recognition particle receptor